MFASFARSICTHCLPGPSSTHEPSSPALSPSVTRSSVPTTGLLSLAVTFLPLARFTVPAGTMKSGRLPFIGGSRLGTLSGTGVPTNSGRGSSVFSGTFSCARAAEGMRIAAASRYVRERVIFIVSGFHFFVGDVQLVLGRYRLIGFVNHVFTRERLIGGAIQFRRSPNRVEKILKMRLMWRLVEEHRNLVLRQLRCLPYVHFCGVGGGHRLGRNVALLHKVIP